jgi:hypothetical protein
LKKVIKLSKFLKNVNFILILQIKMLKRYKKR